MTTEWIETLREGIARQMIIGLLFTREDIELCERARKLFTEYNARLYGGDLPETRIYFNLSECGVCGEYCSYLPGWYGGSGGPAIVIYPQEIMDTEQLKEVLLHEMAHEYCALHNIEDITRTIPAQHTAAFADVCRAHGLCYDDGENDWMNTRLSDKERAREC